MGKFLNVFPPITVEQIGFSLKFYLEQLFCTWKNFSKFRKIPNNLCPKHTQYNCESGKRMHKTGCTCVLVIQTHVFMKYGRRYCFYRRVSFILSTWRDLTSWGGLTFLGDADQPQLVRILRNTINRRSVRILLECILVLSFFTFRTKLLFGEDVDPERRGTLTVWSRDSQRTRWRHRLETTSEISCRNSAW